LFAVANAYPCRRLSNAVHGDRPTGIRLLTKASKRGGAMAKDHGSSVKNDRQYEGLRKKGMSKERAAKIANTPNASKKGGERSGKSK
jgi:hypothetical protein